MLPACNTKIADPDIDQGKGKNMFSACLVTRARQRQHAAHRGFTLLELLVVIVIIGLLAAYVGPKYFSQLGKSEVTVAKAQIEAFSKALDTFRLDVGRYPTTEEGLSALLVPPAGLAKWNGAYLKKEIPLDPWGHSYVYRAPGSKNDYDLISYGRDGQAGGSGEDADITN
jgi:general secretion pathway protein G